MKLGRTLKEGGQEHHHKTHSFLLPLDREWGQCKEEPHPDLPICAFHCSLDSLLTGLLAPEKACWNVSVSHEGVTYLYTSHHQFLHLQYTGI